MRPCVVLLSIDLGWNFLGDAAPSFNQLRLYKFKVMFQRVTLNTAATTEEAIASNTADEIQPPNSTLNAAARVPTVAYYLLPSALATSDRILRGISGIPLPR